MTKTRQKTNDKDKRQDKTKRQDKRQKTKDKKIKNNINIFYFLHLSRECITLLPPAPIIQMKSF